jgi:hypothetical protein
MQASKTLPAADAEPLLSSANVTALAGIPTPTALRTRSSALQPNSHGD